MFIHPWYRRCKTVLSPFCNEIKQLPHCSLSLSVSFIRLCGKVKCTPVCCVFDNKWKLQHWLICWLWEGYICHDVFWKGSPEGQTMFEALHVYFLYQNGCRCRTERVSFFFFNIIQHNAFLLVFFLIQMSATPPSPSRTHCSNVCTIILHYSILLFSLAAAFSPLLGAAINTADSFLDVAVWHVV